MSHFPTISMTEGEYLKFDFESERRNEFLNGTVTTLPSGSEPHNTICSNLLAGIHVHIRPTPCKVYSIQMRLFIAETGLYTYPDICVVCDKIQLAENVFDTLLNPLILVEILSPETEAYDRGAKFQNYRKIPSLSEYILVAQNKPHIEHYLWREEHRGWELMDSVGLDSTLELPSIDCTLSLADVYDKVEFPSADEN